MRNLDEIFKDRLVSHVMVPSPVAWEKVEANLSKKNKIIVWRWAAALLLGGLLLSTPWMLKNNTSETISEKKEEPIAPEIKEIEKSPAPLAEEKTSTKSRKQNHAAPSTTKKTTPSLTTVNTPIKSESVAVLEEKTEEKIIPEATVVKTSASSRSIVLTYTLEDVVIPESTSSTEEKTKTAEVASVEKKEKSIKRVMTFARNVKNGDSPISLRDMKEELFAGDVKKKTSKNH